LASYFFDKFSLDEDQKELIREGRSIPLTKRRYSLLLLLLQRAGDVVTKDELIEKIWGGLSIEESNISQQIYQLRNLLGDDGRNQIFIETLPLRGYRFKAKVTRVEHGSAAIANPGSGEVIPPVHFTSRKNLLGGATVLGMLIIWAGVLAAREGLISRAPSVRPKDLISRPLVSLPGIKTHPAFSRDGRWISFSLRDPVSNQFDLYLISASNSWLQSPKRLTTHPRSDSHSTWSPDHQQIAFLRIPEMAGERYHLMVLDLESGVEREVERVWGGLDWSPDGRSFAVSDNLVDGTSSGIFLLSVDGKSREAVSNPNPTAQIYDYAPQFSPDGTKLLFVRGYTDLLREVCVVDLQTKVTRQLTTDQALVYTAAWSNEGSEIIFLSNRTGSNRLWKMGVDGTAIRPVEGVGGSLDRFALSPTQDQIVFGSEREDAQIVVRSLPGTIRETERPCVIQSSEWETDPQFSPDGKSILFSSNRSGWPEIWKINADCTQATPLTSFEENGITRGFWSPDGNAIIFSRYVENQAEIYRIDLWNRALERITNHPATDILPIWSRDGQWLYFSSNRSGPHQIWRVPAAGGETVQVTAEGGVGICRESIDGKTLFYVRNERLRRLDLLTREDQWVPELRDINLGHSWTVGKEHIYYLPQKTPGPAVLYRYHLQTGKIERLFEVDGTISFNFQGISLDPREERIAITTVHQQHGDLRIAKLVP
jgi:Tol biopolymer transport system component/DNA-binding winged helix-turn-helix (wHTH) protein